MEIAPAGVRPGQFWVAVYTAGKLAREAASPHPLPGGSPHTPPRRVRAPRGFAAGYRGQDPEKMCYDRRRETVGKEERQIWNMNREKR